LSLELLSRTPRLSDRFGANIKQNHAAVDKNIIADYIESLRKISKGVPPENIILTK
jgi:hypothetical protein